MSEPSTLALCSYAIVFGQSVSLMGFLCMIKKCLIIIHVYVCVYLYIEGEDAALSKIRMKKDLLWDG